jgi:hypothetical protein
MCIGFGDNETFLPQMAQIGADKSKAFFVSLSRIFLNR